MQDFKFSLVIGIMCNLNELPNIDIPKCMRAISHNYV